MENTQIDEHTEHQFTNPTPGTTAQENAFLTPKLKKAYKPKKIDPKTVQKMPESYVLSGVVNLLLLLGLTSANMWEKVMFDVRKKVSELMNPDLTALYFHLKMVSHSICTGIVTNSDLSQHKLDMINEKERDYDELLTYAEPILQVYSKYTYSVEIVKMFKDIVEESVEKINLIEISDEEEEVKATGSKKRPHQQECLDDDDDDDADEDELFRLLGKKFGSKKKNAKLSISQQVSVKNENVTRKCTTPGESGQFLIKIEISDCNDLKGLKPTQYWTKIWKKAVFLVDSDKSPSYVSVNNVWANESKRILQLKDSKVTEFEDDEDKDSNRKRARFFR